jgi:WD40 repeat protein
VSASPVVGGQQLWVARYASPEGGIESADGIVVSPGGDRVFVTGTSALGSEQEDFATGAYDATTGTQLWGEPYDGPGNGTDIARAVAASPDGTKVFVTGGSEQVDGYLDFTTIAYDAATGTQLWVAAYDGSGHHHDQAMSIAVSPDAGTVYVTGSSAGPEFDDDFATVAYDAASGAERWVQRYDAPAHGFDEARQIAVSPGGSLVVVTGSSSDGHSATDFETIAYDAATGSPVWARRLSGPAGFDDFPFDLAISPGGSTLFVTGWSNGPSPHYGDFQTIAYRASDGATRWSRRYNGPDDLNDVGNAIAVAPGGSAVYVTGQSESVSGLIDYATVAYRASNGSRLWVARQDGPVHNNDVAVGIAVSPGGSKVFVAGGSQGPDGNDYWTFAYAATTGAKRWNRRYDGPGQGFDSGNAIAAAPDGRRVFVTGQSTNAAGDEDWATIAYAA